MNTELPNLDQLVKATPRTASGRVAAAWAFIRASLAGGKKPREVYEAAERDGLGVPYAQFRVYIHRLRKRDLRRGTLAVSTHSRQPTVAQPALPKRSAPARGHELSQGPSDPLKNVREQRAKKNSFEYNPFPPKGLTK